MKKIALITGATSGIGEATARILAQNNYNIIITGRRDDRLGKLAVEIIEKIGVDCYPLCFDIRNQEETEDAFHSLPSAWQNIDLLVNNAGLAAGLNSIHEGAITDWQQMIDTNIKGLLYITKIVAPIMVKNKSGHIINIGSIAGKEAYANGTVYCGTKHAVEALTKGMRIDLNAYGIKVGSVCPGAVETEFSMVRLKDAKANEKVYAGFEPLAANDIADAILFMATRPAHVNIADIFILPTAQAAATIFNKHE
ncbi:MAG: SDR family NAD(P)-dependent oxidoreductase [Salinivirgaceae bacterium]|jgi:3-hydroxy acid dehydrogenase/malonic semialdehyde reductase|nr:SDR family NAD(P)-dependent oxidoreductase [Salinivirgaceae bacterium]